MRTICFLKSRRGVELIQRFTRLRLEDAGRPDLAERIAPYRAGYTPAQRREIERRLSDGELLAVVATTALELGIDVGDLDAAMVVTFPGTVASLRQMWGRAGRRGRRGSPSTWPARTRSTSSSAATPTSSSTARWSGPSSTRSRSPSTAGTSWPPPTSCRCPTTTPPRSGRAGRRTPSASCRPGRCASGAGATAAGRGLPGGRDLAALGPGRRLRRASTPPRAS